MTNDQLRLKLHNTIDPTIGAVWPAFAVSKDQRYKIQINIRSITTTAGGFYLKVEAAEKLPSTITHTSTNSGSQNTEEPGVWPANSSITLIGNEKLSEELRTYTFYYYPEIQTNWASILVLNWGEMGTEPLEVSQLQVFSSPITAFETSLRAVSELLNLNFQPATSAMFIRIQIWEAAIDATLLGNFFYGQGISNPSISSTSGLSLEHSHNMFVASFYQGGIVGLFLLAGMVLMVYRRDD